jgi:hypothetical protein
VVCAVDIQPPQSQSSERARKRQDRLRRVLKAAEIPLHVWIEGALPTPEAAREQLFPKPVAPELSTTVPPHVGPLVTPIVRPEAGLLPEDPGFEPDEVIEMREPPPSTWFDNLDSGPTPLRPAAPEGCRGCAERRTVSPLDWRLTPAVPRTMVGAAIAHRESPR